MIRIDLSLVCLCFLFSLVQCEFLYVATNGTDTDVCTTASNPCATVAHAISFATDGDILLIARGVYYNQPVILVEKSLITIQGDGI